MSNLKIDEYFSEFYTGKKNSSLPICNTTVAPGEEISIAVQLPEILELIPIYMPVKIIHGKKKGPTILIIGSIHGDGFTGIEIINRLMAMPLLKKIAGSIICLPALNIYGMINRSSKTPDNKDLEFSFPGSEEGSYTERLANIFKTNFLDLADVCIEIKTGGTDYYNIPQVYCDLNNRVSYEIAKGFRVNVIGKSHPENNTIESIINERNIPSIIYKAGEAMRLDKDHINIGVKGIINIMKKIGMLQTSSNSQNPDPKIFNVLDSFWIKSPKSGLSVNLRKIGSLVSKDEKIALIREPLSRYLDTPILSPESGIITCVNMNPLVYEGEALFKISVFDNTEKVAEHINMNNVDSTSEGI